MGVKAPRLMYVALSPPSPALPHCKSGVPDLRLTEAGLGQVRSPWGEGSRAKRVRGRATATVMAGLVPAIHVLEPQARRGGSPAQGRG